MNVNVISASKKDMDAIYLMGFDAWGVGFSTQQYVEACRSSPKYKLGKWFYLEENSAPVSSLIVYKNQFELQVGYAGLGSISTVPSRRGRGFASQLIVDCVVPRQLSWPVDDNYLDRLSEAPDKGFFALRSPFVRKENHSISGEEIHEQS